MIENVEIKKLAHTEIDKFIELIRLFEVVFEMKDFILPEQSYLMELLKRTDFFVFVSLLDKEVIGGLTTHTLPSYYYQSSEVYIYDLAVRTQFQRQGIGKALITSLKDYCKRQGVREIFVQADLVDQYAIDFYHSTGGIEEKVVHFDYPLYTRS